METDGIHVLAAAYALHALDSEEETEFEAHLSNCPRCRRELAAFRETAVSLALGVDAATPSPELRDQIVARVRGERETVVPLRRRWTLPAVGTVAAVAASVAVALGLWAASLSSDLDAERAARSGETRLVELLSDPDARRYGGRGVDGTLVVAPGGEAALVFEGLAPPPPGKVYKAWVSRDGRQMVPAGSFRSSGDRAAVVLTRPVHAGTLVAVTVEDAPATVPTREPFFQAQAT